MNNKTMNWNDTKPLTPPVLLAATFLPSGIAFFGFHVILPRIVASGMPVILAWPVVASVMLSGLIVFALWRLNHEAREMNISLKQRLCLIKVKKGDWWITAGLAVMIMILSGPLSRLSVLLLDGLNYSVPDYMPFFLNPRIDAMVAPMNQLSPGLNLSGQYWIILPVMLTIILNVLTEDLYFRAWMLPKMHTYGRTAWLFNGLLFASYHTFQIWLFPVLLIASCAMAYITQKSKSIIPSLCVHFLINVGLAAVGMLWLIG